jgi:hypothetical protein
MDIDGPTVTEDGASARATFFDTVFVEVPPPPLVAPPAFTAEPPAPTLQLQAKRQSSRLAARPLFVRTMCGSRTGGWSLPCVMSD